MAIAGSAPAFPTHTDDRTLSLHEIQIRPESIPPVTPQVRGRMLVLRGMGREILRTLRQSGTGWRSTSDLVACVEAAVSSVELTPDMHKYVRIAVRRHLRNLLLAGTLERKLPLTSEGKPDGHTQSLWRLVRRCS